MREGLPLRAGSSDCRAGRTWSERSRGPEGGALRDIAETETNLLSGMEGDRWLSWLRVRLCGHVKAVGSSNGAASRVEPTVTIKQSVRG